MVYQNQLDQAHEMARKGATRGMVKVFLQNNGVPDDQFDLERIFKKAVRRRAREVRFRGALMIIGGLAVFVVGVVLMFAEPRMSSTTLPLVFVGLGLAGKGLVDFATGLEG